MKNAGTNPILTGIDCWNTRGYAKEKGEKKMMEERKERKRGRKEACEQEESMEETLEGRKERRRNEKEEMK